MAWWDFYKLWTYQFEKGPLERLGQNELTGAGVVVPDAMPDLRGDAYSATQTQIRLHDSNDFVDLSTVTNRQSRYKEYERLRSVAEVEMAMTVISDEACIAGSTKISTLFDGAKPIWWLTERWKEDPSPFLVYCWDFEKEDYTLGWAYEPRVVKKAKTVRVMLDDGSSFLVTEDHRILTRGQEWVHAGDLARGSELMPFYRLDPNRELNEIKTNQFPRVFTLDGWKHERQFVDEWRNAGEAKERYGRLGEACRLLAGGASVKKMEKMMKLSWKTIDMLIKKHGFCTKELKWLGDKQDRRRVVGVIPHEEIEVYDLSVKDHENFCTDSVIMHNCQKDESGNVFRISAENEDVRKELEFLCFNRKMLNLNRRAWQMVKRLCIFGDAFYELVTDQDNPKEGILKIQELPPDSMYKIVTTKGRVVEFQQSKEGPDYQALTRSTVTTASDQELRQSTAIRFAPAQVIHAYLGDDRRTFYPYGQSLIEPARGPAHQLRLMEDAMMVYRLCLVGETRIRTDDGYKYIRDISVGDKVFSYDQNGGQVETKVLNFVNNGRKEVYRVRSKHMEITGTATHPILVNRKGSIQYVDIQDLVPGSDMMINVRRVSDKSVRIPRLAGEKWAKLDNCQRAAFRNTIYKNKSELMKSCGFETSRVKQFLYSEGKALPYEVALKICDVFGFDPTQLKIVSKGQINSERMNLPEFVDKEFSRLFGFLVGDGCVGKYRLCFASGTDAKQNEYYAGLMRRYFGKVYFSKDKRNKNESVGKYIVNSQEACRIFMMMGYVPGAKNKRIPSWVFTASEEIRRAFVEGISDADGGERRTKAGTWFSTIELCNKRLVEDIKEIWSSIGLCSGKITKRKRNGGHEIVPDRKIKSSVSYVVTISEKQVRKYENILSVERVGEEEVYDITVDNEEHNFIANGTPVHNTRAPERRIFYIDVGQLPPFKAEAFVDRMKDQFRKKKVQTGRGTGANAVDERWHAPAADEDYWIPIRPNANTRIDTLPGAQNLGEIDDALYFRNKLFTALNFPKNYLGSEDIGATRITLSAQDARFARMVERIQASVEDAILEICERHLEMRGFPSETYEDLKIQMTPPSSWKELSEAEIMNNRMNMVTTLKSSMLMSDFDLLTRFMKIPEDEAERIVSRNKIQKLEDLKIQIIGQNPQLLGVGTPGSQDGETEMGIEAGGPTPNLEDMGSGQEGMEPAPEGEEPETDEQEEKNTSGGSPLPDPSAEELKKYDLGMEDYSRSMDREEIDWSEED